MAAAERCHDRGLASAGDAARPVRARPPPAASVGPSWPSSGSSSIGLLTLALLIGRLPFSTGGGSAQRWRDRGAAGATPAPSNVVIVPSDPRADVPGTIAYAKQGSLWLQTGTKAIQMTTGGSDSMPAFTSDGTWIYFIRTVTERGLWPELSSDGPPTTR